MIRFRKKLILLLAGMLIMVTVILYSLMNKTESTTYLDTTGKFNSGSDKTIISKEVISDELDFNEIKQKVDVESNIVPAIKAVKLVKKQNEVCSFDETESSVADINMLDLYDKIEFKNIDGGVWKQGWPITYDPYTWNRHHKLNVFVVPHSHNDPGWIKTFEDYYEHDTKMILNNMLRHLQENENMKFIWCEISYFLRWFESQSTENQKATKKLIENKQLEFVTGGWVMPDEANSHWYNVISQLYEGQAWLYTTFNVTPKSGWAIDPFGHSSTMPYLLKKAGFENMLIQRTHYEVKKALAKERLLEFRWRQYWDGTGNSELFTHMMPFYSYDVPHTCGPDPSICCQFDFRRLPGFHMTCPWRKQPTPINEKNVKGKAEQIVDQWRKKSTLYKTRSVLIPLGDDFRYQQSKEWEVQRVNYEKLFDYINNSPDLNCEAKFGTLQEYFDSVRHEKSLDEFPTLSGDFFTYADREDHYWSGYFTSRPFHKRLDRVLMTYLRSAEMLQAWLPTHNTQWLIEKLTKARRLLSIFQHHDGITGTAKDHVVKDYANMLFEAVKICKFVIQQSVYGILTQSSGLPVDQEHEYFELDDFRANDLDNSRPVIIIGADLPNKFVALHNSLPYYREEVVEFLIGSPYVRVFDGNGIPVDAVIAPFFAWHNVAHGQPIPQISTTKYRLMFKATVPALGVSSYKIQSIDELENVPSISYAKVNVYSDNPIEFHNMKYPKEINYLSSEEIHVNDAIFSRNGLLKQLDSNGPSLEIEFLKYGVAQKQETSGAYLFLPDGPAKRLDIGSPVVLVCSSSIETTITSGLPFAVHEYALQGNTVEIRNLVDIGIFDNTEIVMRLKSSIKNDNVFYTDLNAFQILKRQRLSKIPIQGNYYPVPSTIYIEDNEYRMTLLTNQPLGGSSLSSGQIEIMQDRRLNQDDNRGLGQGVLDNLPSINIFRLIIEKRDECGIGPGERNNGYLSELGYLQFKTMAHPMEKLLWRDNEWSGMQSSFGSDHESQSIGTEIPSIKAIAHLAKIDKSVSTYGLILHRTQLDECFKISSKPRETVNVQKLLNLPIDYQMYETHITTLRPSSQTNSPPIINLCPMDLKAFIIIKSKSNRLV